MKSSNEDLKKRGYINETDIDFLSFKTYEELLNLLHSEVATIRTASVRLLAENNLDNTYLTKELLNLLFVEKSLYTKIEICNTLEKGDVATANQMITYIGKIGNNQYKTLPDKVSDKKSYPLPRDIIARTLGKMSVSVFPVLTKVLYSGDIQKISEILDAIGFMTFYNQNLSTLTNARLVFETLEKFSDNNIIIWKSVLCLSAFPLIQCKEYLTDIKNKNYNNIIGKEAERSLRLIDARL